MAGVQYVEVEDVEVIHETEEAILVLAYGDEVWLPRSQVKNGHLGWLYVGYVGSIEVADWLAHEKGLV